MIKGWGPVIPVNRERPSWLDDEVLTRVRYGEDDDYSDLNTGTGVPAIARDWSMVTALRLPADHPTYIEAK